MSPRPSWHGFRERHERAGPAGRGARGVTATGFALMLCAAAAPADRRFDGAMLERLAWPGRDEWLLDGGRRVEIPSEEPVRT